MIQDFTTTKEAKRTPSMESDGRVRFSFSSKPGHLPSFCRDEISSGGASVPPGNTRNKEENKHE